MSVSTSVRPALLDDLPAINTVIERAVMGWQLPGRVKRLTLSSHQYSAFDLQHMQLLLATDDSTVVGIAAWEVSDSQHSPAAGPALLLHGLYVDPSHQHRGIGRELLEAVVARARDERYAGVLVRAQADAAGFFSACGMQRIAIEDNRRDYPYRFWKAVV